MVHRILDPGESQDERPEEEAAVQVRPDRHDERHQPQPARMLVAIGDEEQHDREQGHPEDLRAQTERDGGDDVGGEREESGGPRAKPAMPTDDVEASEDDADEARPEDGQTRPAGDGERRGEQRLRTPLLVEPGRPRGGERPRVHGRDRVVGEDLVARTQVIGEVDRGQVRDERAQHRQGDREERPEAVQRHPRMLSARGAPSHRLDGPTRAQPTAAGTSVGRTARAPSS